MTCGVAKKLLGRQYVYDAINCLLSEDDKNNAINRISIISHIANLYKKDDGSIYKAMQNAIKYAWRITPPGELETLYQAKVNYNTRTTNPK